MEILIRQENNHDYKVSEEVVEKAFQDEKFSDHKEHFLVRRLRASDAYIPELTLVAEAEVKIVGHIMLSKIKIVNEENQFDSLALAPVSVLPAFQGKGIGSKLIKASLEIAKKLDYKSVIILGHAEYYPRFGFRPAAEWNIYAPFEVPTEAFMAIELKEDSLKNVRGTALYPKEFFE